MNPAGSKLIRKFFKAVHGYKADYLRALRWYQKYDPAKKAAK